MLNNYKRIKFCYFFCDIIKISCYECGVIKMRLRELKCKNCGASIKVGENEIQVWKYNPKMLSTEGVVDKLSLYLSLKDNDDERIQIELDRLINEMSW